MQTFIFLFLVHANIVLYEVNCTCRNELHGNDFRFGNRKSLKFLLLTRSELFSPQLCKD